MLGWSDVTPSTRVAEARSLARTNARLATRRGHRLAAAAADADGVTVRDALGKAGIGPGVLAPNVVYRCLVEAINSGTPNRSDRTRGCACLPP